MPDRRLAAAEEQIFDAVRRSEESMVDAGRTMAKTIAKKADGASLLEFVDTVFDLTERILKSQRELAKAVVATITPAEPAARVRKVAPSKARAARKPAKRKAPARKAATRRASAS